MVCLGSSAFKRLWDSFVKGAAPIVTNMTELSEYFLMIGRVLIIKTTIGGTKLHPDVSHPFVMLKGEEAKGVKLGTDILET
jgi:hypothetical protein